MFRMMCSAKIHNAIVTETKLDYAGSITIDQKLLQEVGILPGERVEVFNLNNGARFSTYTISGELASGKICVNGAAARLAQVGDRVIIIAYSLVPGEEAEGFRKKVISIKSSNRVFEKMKT